VSRDDGEHFRGGITLAEHDLPVAEFARGEQLSTLKSRVARIIMSRQRRFSVKWRRARMLGSPRSRAASRRPEA